MQKKDFIAITLTDFLERGGHTGFSKEHIIRMAVEQCEKGEDFLHIEGTEGNVGYRIYQGSVMSVANPPEPKSELESEKPTKTPKAPTSTGRAVKVKPTKK